MVARGDVCAVCRSRRAVLIHRQVIAKRDHWSGVCRACSGSSTRASRLPHPSVVDSWRRLGRCLDRF
jgi:protein-arginine kinase activator protein McsA